jgi:hypothetical protein
MHSLKLTYAISYACTNISMQTLQGHTKNTTTGHHWVHYLNVHVEELNNLSHVGLNNRRVYRKHDSGFMSYQCQLNQCVKGKKSLSPYNQK